MLKEAIEEIREMAITGAGIETVTIDGNVYAKNSQGNLEFVCVKDTKPIIPETISVSSLSGFVQWVKRETQSKDYLHFVEVVSPSIVTCRTERNAVREGGVYSTISLNERTNTFTEGFRDFETAMIELRSKYQHTDDIDYLLKLLSSVKLEDSVKTDDNGLTQQVTVRKGIALTENAAVKPIVTLKPYRTFLEVEQPESEFLVRIGDNGSIGLFEADGGMWKIKARNTVAEYLKNELSEEINAGKVIVVL